MNRLLTLGLMSATLAACVSDPDPKPSSSSSEAMVSSSEMTISSSSVTLSSAVSSVVSSSPVVSSSSVLSSSSEAPSSVAVSSSSASGFDGDAANGLALFTDKGCTFCHEDKNGDGYFNEATNNTPFDPDELGDTGMFGSYDGATVEGVSSFILTNMAGFAANQGGCDEQCSDDIAAYLWVLRNGLNIEQQEAALTTISCSANEADDIHYGRRTLQVLTSYEYHNSLSKLFGAALPADYSSPSKVSVDTEVARLPNHMNESISETRLNAYYDNAVEIADWAIDTDGALPFVCDDAVACADNFITDFAYVAFRRALSDEEQAEFKDIITGASTLKSGLKWALVTVLNSPSFLYRSELGTQVSELLANPVVAPGTTLSFEGAPTTFNDLEVTRYQRINVAGDTTEQYAWTGGDLIAITVKGVKSDRDFWPILTIGASSNGTDTVLQDITVDHTGARTYYIEANVAAGGKVYFLHNANVNNDYTALPIQIEKLSLGVLGEAKPVQDDVASLTAADQTAFALDPYEYASALSFSLTGAAPSKSLLDAAVAGELVDAASFDAHVDKLIDSDLGIAHIERLAGKWFRTDKLPSRTRNVAEYTPEVRDSMMQEIREIYKHVFYNGDFPSMYSGDFTFLNSTLAGFYGMNGSGGSSNSDFQLVDTTGTLRGGIIASGGFMAYNAHMDYTSPIQRGAHFRQDVLCQAIPQPVNLEDSDQRDIAAALAAERAEAGTITTTDYFDIQTNVEGSSCAGCHNAIINPLFGMDDFDNVGRLRKRVSGEVVQVGLKSTTTGQGDNAVTLVTPIGQADLAIDFVNKNGVLYSPSVVGSLSTVQADLDKETQNGLQFSGAKDLGQKIVENDLPGVSACLIEKPTRYATGYTLNKDLLETEEKEGASYLNITPAQEAEFTCVQNELQSAYGQAKSPRDVLKALVKSSAFRFRK